MTTIDDFRARLQTAHVPEKKLNLILDFISEAWQSEPAEVEVYAREAEMLAVRLHSYEGLSRIHLYRGLACAARGDLDRAVEELRMAYDQLRDHRLAPLMCVAAVTLGDILRSARKYNEAHDWYKCVIEHCDAADPLHARALTSLGIISREICNYKEALDYQMRALAHHEARGDKSAIADALASIGATYALTGDLDSAIVKGSRALDLFRESGDMYGEVRVVSELAGMFRSRGELDRAIVGSLRALAIYEALGDHVNASATLMTVGAIEEDRKEYGAALQYYLKAHDTLNGRADDRLRADVLHSIGRVHCVTGETADAQLMLEHALMIALEINDLRLQYRIHESMSHVHAKLGDYNSALLHHRHYTRLKDEISGEEKQREIAALQVRYDIERTERERVQYRMKVERLESDMKQKENELTAAALNLVQMKEMMDDLKQRIGNLAGESGSSGQAILGGILRELDAAAGAGQSWDLFERQLDNIHHDFVRKLSERHQTLSATELKICSLLKINLSTKDIANLLALAVRTVETHRFNIGRKLDLPKGVRLVNYLAGI